ncbi:MAG: YfhO family protein [Candidatus Amulumruptor caecigallinarius]|nr:YfhO family protein [Candidatus Amulumruptor caecigallinarius]
MKKKYIYSIMATIFMAIVAIIFFYPDCLEGNVLQQHDVMQGTANGQEGIAFQEATGESTRWTNSLFGGMPNFQIAPSYPANKALSWVGNAYMLFLPSPANLLFAMMIGFFIMALCMKLKWHEALFGAIAWGFSSYFIIIIGAGHIWKFATLAYIPPTIGGIALLYRKKYLAGTALAALFGALQLNSNHPQMTYYFMFVILAMVIAWLCKAIRNHTVKEWGIGTACMLGAGVLAVGANSASLYNSYEYAKETVRGKATDLKVEDSEKTGGMSREAITAWSYGIDETFSLLIPNVKGGATIKPVGGENALKSVADTQKADEVSLTPEERQFIYQFPQYFGDQPMTNGPVYTGAFVLLLAVLALFMVKSPLKWALFAVTVLAIGLSWGHNFPVLTNLFIDYFPAYSKFRTVSSILVIVEFTIPLLAMLCVKKMVESPEAFRNNPYVSCTVIGGGFLICFLGWVAPSIFGNPFSATEIESLNSAGAFSNPAYYNLINAIREIRISLVSSDSLRSMVVIMIGALLVWLWLRGNIKKAPVFVFSLAVLTLVDLFSVDRRYVNSENFTEPVNNDIAFKKTAADEAILRDKSNYRVLDVADMGGARSSYFHKTIGGYHAAKLTRYNDLLEKQIYAGNPAVLNMLNTKYIMNGEEYQVNPEALGNAWFVDTLKYVATPDDEMNALNSINPSTTAVADSKFEKVLGKARQISAGDTIYETTYAPNRLNYKAKSAKGGVAVFSEIFFPWGWEATIDGKPVEIGRVNYVLRAIQLPAGTHDIEFRFDPKSIRVTNGIGITSVVIIYAISLAAAVAWCLSVRCHRKRENIRVSSSQGKDVNS